MKKPEAKTKAKRTGPSQRTAAQRRAIDERGRKASMLAKRKQRKEVRQAKQRTPLLAIDGPLSVACPTCFARQRSPCFAYDGKAMGQFHSKRKERAAVAKPVETRPIAPAIARPADGRIDPARVTIGARHRKDFGDLVALARSIDQRGGLLQPIALTSRFELIAGERRLRAWPLTRFAAEPIPFHVVDVDAIVAGEYDENAVRKDFTPSEAVAMQRSLESVLQRMTANAPPVATGKRGRPATGRIADKAAIVTGKSRRTIEKAAKVVAAAEGDQAAFGDLVEEMDRTGKVDVVARKLEVRKQRAAIAAAPAPLPMNAKECATWLIDFPWAGEMDDAQEKLDAADRTFRPYPEMAIKTCCQFARDELAPNLPEQVSIWLAVTNFILTRGYHLPVIAAMGLKPEHACTMLTWGKDKLGRGKVLRDQTEHFILLRRGKPLIDVFGKSPPSTWLIADRRENSRKPDALFRLIERVTPAKRYASIFSRGGEGEAWDGHGDQVGRFAAEAAGRGSGEATKPFAPAIARAAEAALIEEAKAPGVTPVGCSVCQACAAVVHDPDCPQYVAAIEKSSPVEDPPNADRRAGQPADENKIPFDRAAEHQALAEIKAGQAVTRDDAALILVKRGLVHAGKTTIRLTALGVDRLATLAREDVPAEPALPPIVTTDDLKQLDLEEAIAAKATAAPAGDGYTEIPSFLARSAS